MLNLDENKFDNRKNYLWRRKFSEILRSEVCTKWEKWRELKNLQVDEVSGRKLRERSRDNTKAHFPTAVFCKNRWIPWTIQENFKMRNQITVGDCLTFPVNLQRFPKFSFHAEPRQTPASEYMEFIWITGNVPGNQFSTFDSRQDHHQGIQSGDVQRESGYQFQKLQGQIFSQEMTNKIEAEIQCRHLQEGPSTIISLIPMKFPQNFDGCTAKTVNVGVAIRQIPNPKSVLVWRVRFNNQVIACSDFPSEAMLRIGEVEMVDSLDELKSSRSVSGQTFPNFEMLDAKNASALNKIIQNSSFKKKVSLEGTESPERGSVSTRKTDRFHHYFRVTGAHDTVLDYCWFILCYSSWW